MYRSNLARKPNGNVRTDYFALRGGLNLADSALEARDGHILLGVNYEALPRHGYRRFQGFERFDGQALASAAQYWILNYDGGTIAISEGDTITGASSGATALVLQDQVGTVASGYLVITNLVGNFTDDENLEVSATPHAVANGAEALNDAPTTALDATYSQDAIETQRATILKPGNADGSGPTRGVVTYLGDVYAFRDNLAGSECLVWKSTSAGWIQVDLKNRVAFTAGTAEMIEGNTLTQGGVTATILRVVKQTGAWSGGDASTGYLIIDTVSGGPFASGAATDGASGVCTLSGAEVAQTIQPGGRYEFRVDNFLGSSKTRRIYGVNGVDYGFEFDGSVYVPIITGNTVDTPHALEINEFHLTFAFQNGSLQNSATGAPYEWATIGALEIGIGDDITALYKETGNALIIFCDNRIRNLFGKNTAAVPFDLRNVEGDAGAKAFSVHRISGETRFIDDQGFMGLKAVQDYGDFAQATYSQIIQDLADEMRDDFICSTYNRKRSMYRAFYEGGLGISATFNGQELSGFCTYRFVDSGGTQITVRTIYNGDDTNGNEVTYFGDDNGWVYKMDSGTSFDGSSIPATLLTIYSHQGSPSYNKEYKKVVLEIEAEVEINLTYNAQFDFGSGKTPTSTTITGLVSAGGYLWDQNLWNSFLWSSGDVGFVEGGIDGVAANIALQISSDTTYTAPHTIYGITYHYINRRLVR